MVGTHAHWPRRPLAERTLTGLSVLLQSNALKQALQPYTVAGPWGRLLDAETERLGEADVQTFETEGLIGTGAAPAVLSYFFHRIGGRFDGRPTLLIIDEGWLALDDRGFAGQIREWLKTLRKKNARVVFATQCLADIAAARSPRRSSRAVRPASSCRTSVRSSPRSSTSIAGSVSTTGRSRSSAAQRRSATITANLVAATVSSSWALARWRSPSRPPPQSPTKPRSPKPRYSRHRQIRRRLGCATRASIGRPTCSSILTRRPPDDTTLFARGAYAGGVLVPIDGAISPARAQWIVFDPTNYSQNVLTAARALEEVNNQILSLENQAKMLLTRRRTSRAFPILRWRNSSGRSARPSSCCPRLSASPTASARSTRRSGRSIRRAIPAPRPQPSFWPALKPAGKIR